MKQLLAVSLLIICNHLIYAQNGEDVEVTDLIRETQQWVKKDNKMALAWWIPTEYWRIALAGNKSVSKEIVSQLENVFSDYILICAEDIQINTDGSMNYTPESVVTKSIFITDINQKKYYPLPSTDVSEEAATVANGMKPVLAQALGQMGKGMSFYFFKVRDSKNQNLINAKMPGKFSISHSNSEFTWKLPLGCLLPPKKCPIDNEKMMGNWSYCPIHGQKLDQ